MKKILILILILVLLSGCSMLNRNVEEPPEDNGDPTQDMPEVPGIKTRETTFYLPDAQWQVLVPVRMNIPWVEGIARATIEHMIEGNVPSELLNEGFNALLPAQTEILGITIRDGLAKIDFSKKFLEYSDEHEQLVIYGLVYTLTEFPTITEVDIYIEGAKADFPAASLLGSPMSREFGLNLEISSEVEDFDSTQQVVLYFLLPVNESVYYVPVTRVVTNENDLLTTVVTELMQGPAVNHSLLSAIGRGVTLRRVDVTGGRVTLWLTGDLASAGGGQLAADRIRNQLALTLTDIAGVMEVEVLIDGGAPEFPMGIIFPPTFTRPQVWNKLGEKQ